MMEVVLRKSGFAQRQQTLRDLPGHFRFNSYSEGFGKALPQRSFPSKNDHAFPAAEIFTLWNLNLFEVQQVRQVHYLSNFTMVYLIVAMKLIVGLSILNVWLFRANKATPYRGGAATTLKDEFASYGLSANVMYVVGGVKMLLSILLILSIWIPVLEPFAAWGLAAMMAAAVGFHFKVGDPLIKAFPAAIFLTLSILSTVL